MEIDNKIGRKIIKRISEYVDVDINIMDLNGRIVASTDSDRINKVHSGSIEVIDTGQPLILNESDISKYEGSRQGVNLPIMYQDTIKGVVGVSGYPKEILPMTGLIRVSVEILIEQLYIQKEAVYNERKWTSWLQQLLHPSGFDEKLLEQEAIYSLGVDTKYRWKVLVLLEDSIDSFISIIEQRVINRKLGVLFVLPFERNEVLVVLSSKDHDVSLLINDLDKLPLPHLRIGIGDEHYGVTGIRESYHEAKQALGFADEKQRVSYVSEWNIERLVNSIASKEYNQICLYYEEKLNEMGEMYLLTISTYLNHNFSIKETSKVLHIHRNTLQYRLEIIQEKTGLDPRLFHDAFILKTIICKQE